MSLTLIICSIP